MSVMSTGPENPERIKPAIGQVADGVYIAGGLGNALSIDLGDTVVQIDTGYSPADATAIMAKLADFTPSPVGVIVFSHGHLGYNFGVQTWLEAADKAGRPRPPIVAQSEAEALIERFRRTEPFAHLALSLKFHRKIDPDPKPFPLTSPTATFEAERRFRGSERSVEIISAPSETDGAIAAWVPESKVLYGGPACITALPNVGLPLRPPRDIVRWADTLDRLSTYPAEHLVPQYGPVVHGAAAVQEYLCSTVAALRHVHDEVVRLLNTGINRNQAYQECAFPPEIFDKPNLHAGYGSLRDLVDAVWASYVGWWDRNPTNLQPAPEADAAEAVRAAIGDTERVLRHADGLRVQGKHQLALHVVDLLALAPGDDDDVKSARALKAKICNELAGLQDDFAGEALYLSAADIIHDPPDVPTGVR